MNKKTLFASLVLATAISAVSQAAEVPAGVELADTQHLIRGNGAEPASLDPQRIEGSPGSRISKDLFEGLVSQDKFGNTIPAGAESWDVTENKVFTFSLRKDARWSDGKPVTAHDYVFAFQRAVDPQTASPYSWYIQIPGILNADEIIAGDKPASTLGVKAVDDYTFEVTLQDAVPFFVKMLAHQTTFPAPRHVVEQFGDNWTRPGNIVSNGAYKLQEWVVNEKIVLTRNTNYWNDEKTVIEQVTWLPIESENAELSRYKAGEVHITNGSTAIPLEHLKQLRKEIPDEIRITPQIGTYYYEFNNLKAPFDDARVRKALSYAINREVITKFIVGQGERATYTFSPDNVVAFGDPENPWSTMSQKERNAEAKKLLKAAGYDKSNPLSVTLLYNTSDSHKKVAIAVSQMWKQALGVNVTLENQEWKTYLESRRQGDYQIARGGWIGDYNEASTMLSLLTTENGNNHSKFSDAEYDKLLAGAMSVETDEERSEVYKRAEKILAEKMPIAPIYQYVTGRLVKSFVGGYPVENPEDNVYARDLYIIKQ